MKIENKYKDLWENYSKTKSESSLQELLKALKPTIEKGIKVFGGGLPNLYAKAKLLTVNALENYSPEAGGLDGYIMLHLQRLRRIAPQIGTVVSVPEIVRMQKRTLEDTQRELEDKLGRPPSDQEIADTLGISLKKLIRLRTASGAAVSSAFGEELGTKQLISKDAAQLLKESVYKELSPIQQYIMERRFGMHGKAEENIETIASKLKISVGQVHNHIKKIQNMLSGLEQYITDNE